ncbi:MAG: MarR family transcriptional regulator [Hyphomonadaceae bacterium]|nr:MarR family transcriptional regulator [Hyphomonadaceae bacterium]
MKTQEQARLVFQSLTEIAIIAHLADTRLAQDLPNDLSVAGFGVLNHFARLGLEAESPTKLARAFQVTKGAMTYTLQALEAQGYVRIDPDPADARGKLVRVTKAGLKAREAAIARVMPGIELLLQQIPAAEFEGALPLLTKLRQALDAARG